MLSAIGRSADIRHMQHPLRAAQSDGTPRFVMPARESIVVARVRRAMITVACLYALIFSWSIYRRLWQTLRIELSVSSTALAPGAVVSTDVVASGETQNRIRLELIQGSHAETLIEQKTRVNWISGLDPRPFRYTPTYVITPELLARFTQGPATLRLTGFGGRKLLRTPPPRVRELQVTLNDSR